MAESDTPGYPDPERAARIEKLKHEVKLLEMQKMTDECIMARMKGNMAGLEKALRTKLYKRILRKIAQKNNCLLIPYKNKVAKKKKVVKRNKVAKKSKVANKKKETIA